MAALLLVYKKSSAQLLLLFIHYTNKLTDTCSVAQLNALLG